MDEKREDPFDTDEKLFAGVLAARKERLKRDLIADIEIREKEALSRRVSPQWKALFAAT